MNRKIAIIAVCLVTLAGCSAQTGAPSNVTASSATYNATAFWNAGDGPGEFWFEHSINGGAFTEATAHEDFPELADSGSAPVNRNITGLPSGATVRYRFCGFLDDNPSQTLSCFDSAGARNGTNYTMFQTAAAPNDCDRTVPSGTGFSAATGNLPTGSTVCLSAGTYTWNDYSPPAGITIKALPGVDATVVGEARISNSNVTLHNLTLRAPATENHAVVYITASDVTTSQVEVDTNHVPRVQGYLVGAGSRAKILDTVIHGARGELRQCADTTTSEWGDNKFHAIYWFGQTNGEVRRVWMYDNGGYGLHFYSGTSAGTQVAQTVTDDSLCGRGNVFDSQTGPTTFDRTIITDAGAWSCRSSGATVTNSRSQSGYSGCQGSGNVTADTVYQDEDGRDYRVPGNPDFQFVPGPGG